MRPEMASEEELASRRPVGNMNTGGDRAGRLKEKLRAPSSCSTFWIFSFRTTSDNFNYRYSCRVEKIQSVEQPQPGPRSMWILDIVKEI